jgi:divalent metal cation (Fe/Co/Zn/Cd) transporter
MDRNERLEVAHDVAEDLQMKIEKLPEVERAFVHIDYETSHKPVSLCCAGRKFEVCCC